MATQTITLMMPEAIFQRARRTANALRQPLEKVIVETLNVALPGIDEMPAELTDELEAMRGLPNDKLWDIAGSVMPSRQQARLRALSAAQRERALTPAELQKLDDLLQEYGRKMLRKSQAYACLHERGLYTHSEP